MTNDAYRDDLEAALARASDLEREVEELRRRNTELEAGDRGTIEASENALRLAAAIERERSELEIRRNQNADDAMLREAAKEAARTRPELERRSDRRKGIAALIGSMLGCFLGFMAHNQRVGAFFAIPFALIAMGLVILAESFLYKRRQKGDNR